MGCPESGGTSAILAPRLDFLPHWHVLSTLEGMMAEATPQMRARRSSHSDLCFLHLLHLNLVVCSPGLDPGAESAPLRKVATSTTLFEHQDAAAVPRLRSVCPLLEPRGRKESRRDLGTEESSHENTLCLMLCLSGGDAICG